MPIPATNPTTVPAIPEATYPLWWINTLQIDGTNTENVRVYVILRKYRTLDDGSLDFCTSCEPITVAINDVLSLARTDSTIATAVGSLLNAVQQYGTNQGVL